MQKKLIKMQRERAKEERRQEEKGARRVTSDGYKIYKLEELGVGKGGDTDLCPFDCECCF
jgi:Eukaryotic protein of unknown function (DUF1764)